MDLWSKFKDETCENGTFSITLDNFGTERLFVSKKKRKYSFVPINGALWVPNKLGITEIVGILSSVENCKHWKSFYEINENQKMEQIVKDMGIFHDLDRIVCHDNSDRIMIHIMRLGSLNITLSKSKAYFRHIPSGLDINFNIDRNMGLCSTWYFESWRQF